MIKFIFSVSLLAAAPIACASESSLSAGFDYSTGKYGGDTDTKILYIPVTGKYQTDKLTLKLTVPYISVTSMGTVIRGMGVIRKSTATKVTTQSGLGDIAASAGYNIYDSASLAVDLVGKIKFATASASKGLGTGENDYSAQLDGYYFVGNISLFATLGHRIVGAPEGAVVNNVNYGTVGLSRKLDETRNAGVMLEAAQSATELSPGTRELTLFISNKIRRDLKWQANVMKGLSDASPDYGFGLMLIGTF